jgi:hypothetical protein
MTGVIIFGFIMLLVGFALCRTLWSEIIAEAFLIADLRSEPGNSIEICCDNDDPETKEDQCAVILNAKETKWEPIRFQAESVLKALQKAETYRHNRRMDALIPNRNDPTNP